MSIKNTLLITALAASRVIAQAPPAQNPPAQPPAQNQDKDKQPKDQKNCGPNELSRDDNRLDNKHELDPKNNKLDRDKDKLAKGCEEPSRKDPKSPPPPAKDAKP